MQHLLQQLDSLGISVQSIVVAIVVGIGGWVSTYLIPYLKALETKVQADLKNAGLTTKQKVLDIVEQVAAKVAEAVLQSNFPNLLEQIESGAITTKSQIASTVEQWINTARTNLNIVFKEVLPEIESLSPYASTIAAYLRSLFSEATKTAIAKLADKTGAKPVSLVGKAIPQ